MLWRMPFSLQIPSFILVVSSGQDGEQEAAEYQRNDECTHKDNSFRYILFSLYRSILCLKTAYTEAFCERVVKKRQIFSFIEATCFPLSHKYEKKGNILEALFTNAGSLQVIYMEVHC